MRIRSLAVFGFLLSVLAACGGGDAERTYVLSWGSSQVQAGAEGTSCVTLDLGNDRPVKINEIRNVLGTAAVELIVYRVDTGSVNATPVSCQPFIDPNDPAAGTPLMITLLPEQTLTLPEGVAFSLAAHQKIRLQLRFLNATSAPVNLTASTEFRTVDESGVEHEAGFLVAGNLNISIPSGAVYQLGPKSIAYPAALHGAHVFAMTGLTHKLGTSFKAGLVENGLATTLYEPDMFNWSAPQTALLAPAATLPIGGTLQLTCTYNNQTGSTVTFGLSSSDEVCFVAAYYYPRQDATFIF